MKEITPLLEKLAKELGTTVQYLWSVLLKQATISGITDIIQYCILAIFVFFYWKYTKHFYKKIEKDDWDDHMGYYLTFFIIGALILILLIAVFLCFPNTITAFFNPEYWALKRVLFLIKK